MTSQPMGIEDFLVIDGPMSQKFLSQYSTSLYPSYMIRKMEGENVVSIL